LRYNTEDNVFEGFSGSWLTVGSAVTTPVGITGVSVDGNSWIVTTDNASGALGVHVTFADDPVVYTAAENPTTMTAGYVASASSEIPGDPAQDGFSGTNNMWTSTTGTFYGDGTVKHSTWIQLQHPKRCILQSFYIGAKTGGAGAALAITIQGSNDNSKFDNIQSHTFAYATQYLGGWKHHNITNPHIPYIYWRVSITQINSGTAVSCAVGFNTIASNVKVGNAFQKNTTQFEIDMVDYAGYPAAIATNASNKFNILLIKDGKVVTEGLYTFSAASGSATKAT
jgi:hypothetical protein